MSLDRAIAILSHARCDIEEVVPVLCQLATMAHALGQYQSRDDSIESAAELLAYCGDRLATFKRPAMITILPEIPKGPTGKVQRRNLAGLVGE